jgi:hypothetical protein
MSKKRPSKRVRKRPPGRKSLEDRRAKKEIGDILGTLEEGKSTLENVEALLQGKLPSREDVTGTFEKFFGEFRGLDLQAELEKARAPQERAVQWVLEAALADNDDEREDFARRALGEHIHNADAWCILASVTADPDKRREHLGHALEAAEKALGDAEPSPAVLTHRPWFRVRAAIAALPQPAENAPATAEPAAAPDDPDQAPAPDPPPSER